MATRKKAKKNSKKQKPTVAQKAASKKQARKKASASRKLTASAKKSAAQNKQRAKKRAAAKTVGTASQKSSRKTLPPSAVQPSSWRVQESPAGLESGDLEGLSNRETVDSESVDELLEDGDAFEAGVVSGVEAADDSDAEVRSHEVPEDDVPKEYLDED
jgi:hypothetical protein